MSSQISKFKCDVCGDIIDSAQLGNVHWDEDDDQRAVNFRIVHRKKCSKGTPFEPLDKFVGELGLAYLLSFLSIGQLKLIQGQDSFCKVKDFDQFVDFFRRVQTPFYEEARQQFTNENVLNNFADSNQVNPYLPETLQRISKEYAS